MSNPLSKLVEFIRVQIAGAPVERVEEAVAGIEEHVEAEIRAAVEPLRQEIEALKGGAPAAGQDVDLFAGIREEIAELRSRVESAQPAASVDLKALHDRVVALETAKPAAPARAAAPAARPAATTA